MKFLDKLKGYENQYMFIRWAFGGEYGKLRYVGEDYIEFDVIDPEYASYRETMLIMTSLILEIAIGGPDISRLVAEVSSQLSPKE